MTKDEIENNIYNILLNVMDPELEIDIVNLGLIYNIQYTSENKVEILMTLSTPNCPLSDVIVKNITESIKISYPSFTVNVEITFSPPWNTEMISEEGKIMLGQ